MRRLAAAGPGRARSLAGLLVATALCGCAARPAPEPDLVLDVTLAAGVADAGGVAAGLAARHGGRVHGLDAGPPARFELVDAGLSAWDTLPFEPAVTRVRLRSARVGCTAAVRPVSLVASPTSVDAWQPVRLSSDGLHGVDGCDRSRADAVTFLAGGDPLGTDSEPPFELAWTPVPGEHGVPLDGTTLVRAESAPVEGGQVLRGLGSVVAVEVRSTPDGPP